MSEQLLDLVDGATGVEDVAGEPVPQRMRVDRPIHPRAPGRCCQELVDSARCHRRADRRPEQVHEHEVALPRRRYPGPLGDVVVVCLNHQLVDWHTAKVPRLRPRTVAVLAANNVQM